MADGSQLPGIGLTVNGCAVTIAADPFRPLSAALRDYSASPEPRSAATPVTAAPAR